VIVREHRKLPAVMAISSMLSYDNTTDEQIFDRLGVLAGEGAFEDDETLLSLLETLAEYTERRQAGGHAMNGMRYPEKAKQFWISIRGRGPQCTSQFIIAKQVLGGPSGRTIQRAVADAAQGFNLIGGIDYVRVDQYLAELDELGLGEVALCIMADATKLPKDTDRPAISFTPVMAKGDIIGHIVGSPLNMAATAIRVDDDVDAVWDAVEAAGGAASQVLAVMVGPPLDGVAPKVVGLFPTNGKENGKDVKAILEELRNALHQRKRRVLSWALDGGSAEKRAQRLMLETEADDYLELHAPKYNITLKAPIVDGTPLIMIQDVEHARKTFRNNLTSGARLMLPESSVICYEYLLRMLGYEGSGIVQSDLMWQDKQDDGAALRLFNAQALESLLEDGKIREGMEGVFTPLSIFGMSERSLSPRFLADYPARRTVRRLASPLVASRSAGSYGMASFVLHPRLEAGYRPT
jgi:hypothetical protein